MKKSIILFTLTLLLSATLSAQGFAVRDPNACPMYDRPFMGIEMEQSLISTCGLTTIDKLSDLFIDAASDYRGRRWQQAAESYELYILQGTLLARILTDCSGVPDMTGSEIYGNSPLYDNSTNTDAYRKEAELILRNRDVALMRAGMSYMYLGDKARAVAYLWKGLRRTDGLDPTEVNEARRALSEIIGFRGR
jgi:hypothetical protein